MKAPKTLHKSTAAAKFCLWGRKRLLLLEAATPGARTHTTRRVGVSPHDDNTMRYRLLTAPHDLASLSRRARRVEPADLGSLGPLLLEMRKCQLDCGIHLVN